MIFLQPNYLWGLLALAIPIIVHLFHFRRYKNIHFSDISILKNVKSKTSKRSRLKQLLILFARMLAIIAVVMIFAQPVFNHQKQMLQDGNHYIFIYIDNSQSMRVQGEKGNLLTHAKNDAYALLNQYNLSDKVQILTNDNIFENSSFTDKNRARKQIEAIQFSPYTIASSQVIKRVKMTMQKYKNIPYKIFILTDMQLSSFDLSAFEIDSLSMVDIIRQKGTRPGNLYIDSCWFDQKSLYLDQQVKLNVRIKNSGNRDYEKVPLKLMVNGTQKSLSVFSVLKNQGVTTELTYLLDNVGFQEAEIVIDDQPITFDNRFYFNYHVGEKIKVVEIYEKTPNPYFEKLFKKDSLVTYQSKSIYKINFSEIKNARLLILNELGSISSGFKEMVIQILHQKNTDVLFVPNVKSVKSNNDLLSLMKMGTFKSLDTVKNRVGELATSHPLYRDVFNEAPNFTSNKNYDMPLVYQYFPYQSKLNNRVLMRLENGNPFLVTDRSLGLNVYLFTTPLSPKNTSFTAHSFFVPTVYKMALMSVRYQQVYHVIGNVKPILLSDNNITNNSIIRLKNKAKGDETMPTVIYKNNQYFIQPNIKKEGHYHLYNDTLLIESLSFNMNAIESDLTVWEQVKWSEELEALGLQQQINIYDDKVEKVFDNNEVSGKKLWSLFVILALIFLLAEVLIIRFMK